MKKIKALSILILFFSMAFYSHAQMWNSPFSFNTNTITRFFNGNQAGGGCTSVDWTGGGWTGVDWTVGSWFGIDWINVSWTNRGWRSNVGGSNGVVGWSSGGSRPVGAPLDGRLLILLGAAGIAYYVLRRNKKNKLNNLEA